MMERELQNRMRLLLETLATDLQDEKEIVGVSIFIQLTKLHTTTHTTALICADDLDGNVIAFRESLAFPHSGRTS